MGVTGRRCRAGLPAVPGWPPHQLWHRYYTTGSMSSWHLGGGQSVGEVEKMSRPEKTFLRPAQC